MALLYCSERYETGDVMVKARVETLEAKMRELGWRTEDLASQTGVALNTVRNLLDGKGVGGQTISRVMRVFPGLKFEELFTVAEDGRRARVAS